MISPIQNQPIPERTNEASRTAAREVKTPFAKRLGEVKDRQVKDEIYDSVMENSAKYNLPPELILGVIRQESGFQSCATSSAGACGVMQLMPETARELGVTNRYDVRQNIEGGCKYLRQLSDRYDGDLDKTLAAYNAGPGNVDKYGGIPPFAETQNYVTSIKSHIRELGGLHNSRAATDAVLGQLDLTSLSSLMNVGDRSAPEFGELPSFARVRGRV